MLELEKRKISIKSVAIKESVFSLPTISSRVVTMYSFNLVIFDLLFIIFLYQDFFAVRFWYDEISMIVQRLTTILFAEKLKQSLTLACQGIILSNFF